LIETTAFQSVLGHLIYLVSISGAQFQPILVFEIFGSQGALRAKHLTKHLTCGFFIFKSIALQ
jgi:hypothetical protein